MKKIAAVLLVIFAFVAFVPAAMADNGPETIVIDKAKAKMAPVELKHAEHQKRTEGKCAPCHHKSKEGETPKACSECHGKVDGAPGYKDAMHKQCQPCHKEQKAAGKNPPTKCMECHKK